MNIKLQWMGKGEVVKEPALIFAFDNVGNLFKGNLEDELIVGWHLPPFESLSLELDRPNNLVITGFGNVAPVEPTFTKWPKGEPENGTHRYVYPLFNDPALPFRAGLTLHAAKGTWSSLPHEFEREEILTPRPMPFYEKFAYITAEPGGWGIQTRIGHLFEAPPDAVGLLDLPHRIDAPNRDMTVDWINDAVVIRDRDILDIPLGSHPVTMGPGILGGYFWIYWGSLEGREKFTKDKAL